MLVAANGYTVVTNDPRTTRLTGVNRHEMQEAQAGAKTDDKVVEDELGGVFATGRGVLDKNVTYIQLYNTSGTKVYIYPNAAGNGLVVSTVKP